MFVSAVCLAVRLSLRMSVSGCASVFTYVCVSARKSVSMSVCVCVCLCVSVSICVYSSISVELKWRPCQPTNQNGGIPLSLRQLENTRLSVIEGSDLVDFIVIYFLMV